ncbi:MAG TPA: nucleotide exchange factor GrpE [Hyphomonadaceae bacterium]|mgnify:CR=1 FL=1|jgi:molecular chaperone GrpE|nr:nucleotide exchange factor GrpE [Hyphomonadaceae bacterium]HPN06237.1 nucleotide exchange factor GrpE [Hyphomonadaceae bacterium]
MNGNNGGSDEDAILSAENEGMDEAVGHPRDKASAGNPAAGAVNILAEQVAALEKERDELKNNMLRALAETDNVRKRANRQIDEARLYAVEKFARDLLNVSDNLSRAIESVPADSRGLMTDAVKTALEGVELTQKELVSVLARHGVTAVDAMPGAAFDPALHQAVTQIPSEHPAGSVAQLFQSGWRIGDRTLRAAMVAVSAGGGKPN